MKKWSARKAKKEEATKTKELGKAEETAPPATIEENAVAEEATPVAPADAETPVEEESKPVEEEVAREAAPEEVVSETKDILADLEGEGEKKVTEIDAKSETEPTTGLLCCA